MTFHRWFERLSLLESSGQGDEAVYQVLATLDSILSRSKLELADSILDEVDAGKFGPTLLVAFLSGTVTASNNLPSYGRLFGRVKTRLTELCPDRVDRLLDGLAPLDLKRFTGWDIA